MAANKGSRAMLAMVFLAVCAGVVPVAAGESWRVLGRERLRAGELSAWRAKVESGERSAELEAAVFRVGPHDFRVWDAGLRGEGSLARVAPTEDWQAGVNGGYFHPDREPLGLVISGGKSVHGWARAALLGGVLVAKAGSAKLLRAAEFRGVSDWTEALQAGPFLVDGGAVTRGLGTIKVARRTFVATDGKGRWAMGILSPVSLAQAGEILATRELLPGLRVSRALNLDGGSSSAFWVAGDPPLSRAGFGPVRNFLGVVPAPARGARR